MLLFSTDIDGTIYDGPRSAAIFSDFWNSTTEQRLLVYNTGRSLDDTRRLIEEVKLPQPDFLICGVGTLVYDRAADKILDDYQVRIGVEWDFDVVHDVVSQQTAARPQPPECQNDNKCSWFWEDADAAVLDDVVAEIARRGVKAQAVYSSNVDLDLLPVRANKGNAVRWLTEHLGISLSDVVVAGDSGNDSRMYGIDGVKGIVVANAEKSLVDAVREHGPYYAVSNCAEGVVEGLRNLRAEVFPLAS